MAYALHCPLDLDNFEHYDWELEIILDDGDNYFVRPMTHYTATEILQAVYGEMECYCDVSRIFIWKTEDATTKWWSDIERD